MLLQSLKLTGIMENGNFPLEIQVDLLYVFMVKSTAFLSTLRPLKLVSSPVPCDTKEHRYCNGQKTLLGLLPVAGTSSQVARAWLCRTQALSQAGVGLSELSLKPLTLLSHHVSLLLNLWNPALKTSTQNIFLSGEFGSWALK